MSTTLIGVRKPTPKEKKEHDAEVVFLREDENGRHVKIYAAKCYESWEQWGATRDELCDNVDAVEAWRNRRCIPFGADVDDEDDES